MVAKERFAELFQVLMFSIGVCFQVLKHHAELGKGVSQEIGILKQIASFASFRIEPADRKQQGDYPELGAEQREDVQKKEHDGQSR